MRCAPASIGVHEPVPRERVLAAQVQVAVLAAGRVGRRSSSPRSRERILLDHDPVLERARLGLVGVADEVVRPDRLPGDGLPLAPGRERGAAAAEQLRRPSPRGSRRPGPSVEARAAAPRSRRGRGSCRGSSGSTTPTRRSSRSVAAAPLRDRVGHHRLGQPAARAPRRRRPRARRRDRALGRLLARLRHQRGRRPLAQAEAGAPSQIARPSPGCSPAGPTVRSSSATSSSPPRHMQAMSSQTCATTGGARLEREQGVEARDAVGLGGRDRQPPADVVERARADPADARLHRVQRRQQQVALVAGGVAAARGVAVGLRPRRADPGRLRRAEHARRPPARSTAVAV